MGDGLARILTKQSFDAEACKFKTDSVISNIDTITTVRIDLILMNHTFFFDDNWHIVSFWILWNVLYVSVIAKISIDGEDALLDLRQKVHGLNENTAQALKKNVYKNYSQFIETAREISSKSCLLLLKASTSFLSLFALASGFTVMRLMSDCHYEQNWETQRCTGEHRLFIIVQLQLTSTSLQLKVKPQGVRVAYSGMHYTTVTLGIMVTHRKIYWFSESVHYKT